MARPKHTITMADIEARSIPEPNTGCWLWLLAPDVGGYGRVVHSAPVRRFEQAHRVACRLVNGPFPDNFEVHHKCRQPACVNPAHLVALPYAKHRAADFPNGTTNQNTYRTHCKNGHPLFGENMRLEKSRRAKSGYARRCRACEATRKREQKRLPA